MSNRYDNGSISKFNPLSFQELSAVPLIQRQKHDQLIAQQEMLRQGLAKTNPHEKYFDEAIRLKNDLNNQITSQAELLSKEGVNPNSQSDFFKLNRNYQETMSPTGKLGMINAHNVNLQTTYKNYIDDAIKANQSPVMAKLHADMAIQKHLKEPLYDEKGRVIDFSAGNAAPKYIDNVKWINELASKVGFTESNWAQASSGMSKNADGRFVVNSSAKGMTKDNIENLNKLAQAANREVSNPASEIRQNIDYNFKNPQTELDSMLNQLYARREREDGVTDRTSSRTNVNWNDIQQNPNLGQPVGVDYNTTEIGGKKSNISEISKIGSSVPNRPIIGYDQTTHSPIYGGVSKNIPFSSKDIKDPIQKTLYDTTWEKYKNGNLIVDGKYMKPTEKGLKLGKDNAEIAKTLSNFIQRIPAQTYTTKILKTDQDFNNSGFAGTVGKTVKERDTNIRRDLMMTSNDSRKFIDTDGKTYDFGQIAKKYGVGSINDVFYQGYLSPLNLENTNIIGTGSKASPHIVTVKVKDGDNYKFKEFKVTRSSEDNKGINSKRMNDLYENHLPTLMSKNTWIPFKSDSPALKDFQIKYNLENPKVNEQGDQLKYEMKDSQGKIHYFTPEEYINTINSIR